MNWQLVGIGFVAGVGWHLIEWWDDATDTDKKQSFDDIFTGTYWARLINKCLRNGLGGAAVAFFAPMLQYQPTVPSVVLLARIGDSILGNLLSKADELRKAIFGDGE